MANRTFFELSAVKDKLHIDDADQDAYVERLGSEADNYINLQLSMATNSIPVSIGTDKELRSLANKHAAAEYLMWNAPDHPRALYDSARKDIQDHIKTNYGKQNPAGMTRSTIAKTASKINGTEGS